MTNDTSHGISEIIFTAEEDILTKCTGTQYAMRLGVFMLHCIHTKGGNNTTNLL